jgi:hypothetical protein
MSGHDGRSMEQHTPQDFTTFVATHEARLSAACRELTADSHLAGSVARDLMAAVALRWRRLRRSPDAAERHLDRLIRREATAWQARTPRQGRPRLVIDEQPATSVPLADLAWARARRMRVRRTAIAVVAVVLLGLFATVAPRRHTPPPETLPTEPPIPQGVIVMPPFGKLAALSALSARLPAVLPTDPAGASELSQQPVTAAVAVVRRQSRALVVVAADGTARRIDDLDVASARLLPTSLSPDGTHVAMVDQSAIRVIDLTTGSINTTDVGPVRGLVWRGARTLLVATKGAALRVDLDGAGFNGVRGVTGLDVAAGPSSEPLVELLAPEQGHRPLIRVWRTDPTANLRATAPRDVDDRAIFGPPWVGQWQGAAWSTVDLLARACDPEAIPLPVEIGLATAAVTVVRPNGLVAGTLVSLDAPTLDVIGFADAHTVLLNVGVPAASSIVVAWDVAAGALHRVTASNPYLEISLADMRASPTNR